MAAPAAAVEVGDGRERGHLGCCGPRCYILSERAPEVVTGGASDWKEGGDGERRRGREINANASFTYIVIIHVNASHTCAPPNLVVNTNALITYPQTVETYQCEGV